MKWPAVAVLAALIGGSDAVACESLLSEARAARTDVSALRTIYVAAEDDCDLQATRRIGAALAIALYRRAQTESAEAAEQSLEEALKYDRRWQILSALGSIHSKRGHWEQAAIRYQEALLEIEQGNADATPSNEVIAALLRKANNARAAAPVYVRTLRTRANKPGGIASERVGGLEIEVVPFPIEFRFRESTMTEKGRVAALDLAEIIASQSPARITLVGHTDPVGSDAFNDRLSLERAEAVRQFLYQQGITSVQIAIEGRGERQPPDVDDPGQFSREELHQIYRRVELSRD